MNRLHFTPNFFFQRWQAKNFSFSQSFCFLPIVKKDPSTAQIIVFRGNFTLSCNINTFTTFNTMPPWEQQQHQHHHQQHQQQRNTSNNKEMKRKPIVWIRARCSIYTLKKFYENLRKSYFKQTRLENFLSSSKQMQRLFGRSHFTAFELFTMPAIESARKLGSSLRKS